MILLCVRPCRLKLVAIGNRLSSTPLLDSPYIHKGVGPGFENPAHSSMLLSTPCNDLLGLSPIGSDLVPQGRPLIACTPTPSKGPASSREKFVPVTPLLSPISINTQATSTPNGAGEYKCTCAMYKYMYVHLILVYCNVRMSQ